MDGHLLEVQNNGRVKTNSEPIEEVCFGAPAVLFHITALSSISTIKYFKLVWSQILDKKVPADGELDFTIMFLK